MEIVCLHSQDLNPNLIDINSNIVGDTKFFQHFKIWPQILLNLANRVSKPFCLSQQFFYLFI